MQFWTEKCVMFCYFLTIFSLLRFAAVVWDSGVHDLSDSEPAYSIYSKGWPVNETYPVEEAK